MMNDLQKVKAVTMAYEKYVRAALINPFIRTTMPAPESKHFANCVAFYDCAALADVSLISFMISAMEWLPISWCQKTFHRDYPPMTVVVAEKMRSHVLESYPKISKSTRPDQIVSFYFDQLKGFGREKALDMVEYGFFPDKMDSKIKEQVIMLLSTKVVA